MKTIVRHVATYDRHTSDAQITAEISACIGANNIHAVVSRFHRMEQLRERDFLITLHGIEDTRRVFSDLYQNDPRFVLLEKNRIIVKIFDDSRINKILPPIAHKLSKAILWLD
ncbi:MAG: hypothetical protein WCI39_10685 [Gallionellaceae bacterium]